MTSISYLLSGDDPVEAFDHVVALGARRLAEAVVNGELNGLIANRDGGGVFSGADDGKMHVPYAGWYWREVDFFGQSGVTIACDGSRTVVCESNKWGYDQRRLTDSERDQFRALVWAALQESRRGGQLSKIHEATDAALAKAGELIASLDVAEELAS